MFSLLSKLIIPDLPTQHPRPTRVMELQYTGKEEETFLPGMRSPSVPPIPSTHIQYKKAACKGRTFSPLGVEIA